MLIFISRTTNSIQFSRSKDRNMYSFFFDSFLLNEGKKDDEFVDKHEFNQEKQ
jgi:hypothetical protein